ncbi:MAG: diaminopimelate epimerase [Flavobacteriales bacterium]|jgi:diaminopimelate epimerase
MRFIFSKYQGTGNDFIMADNRDSRWRLSKGQIMRLCDRHFGIGSDGLILIGASDDSDFFMDFYNPDGSQSFCGNGSRCAVDFFRKISGGVGERFTFRAIDGLHEAIWSPDEIRIKMKDVSDIELCGEGVRIHTGSPHLLRYVPVPDDVDVFTEGREIRYSEPWKEEGINVNFIGLAGDDHIVMRTYERGVENETLSCGTGVTAAALSYHHLHGGAGDVRVDTMGGQLRVMFREKKDAGYEDIWLCGPGKEVFQGEIELIQE